MTRLRSRSSLIGRWKDRVDVHLEQLGELRPLPFGGLGVPVLDVPVTVAPDTDLDPGIHLRQAAFDPSELEFHVRLHREPDSTVEHNTLSTVFCCGAQGVAAQHVSGYFRHRMTYGERFRALRERSKRTSAEIARDLGATYANSIYGIEKSWRAPSVPTIAKHAIALQCQPWELLEGVETEHDLLRAIGTLPRHQRETALITLLANIASTKRGSARASGLERTPADSMDTRRASDLPDHRARDTTQREKEAMHAPSRVLEGKSSVPSEQAYVDKLRTEKRRQLVKGQSDLPRRVKPSARKRHRSGGR